MNNQQIEDIRAVVGFGLGTSRLDNELIREAFIMGAGFGSGTAIDYMNLGDEKAMDLAMQCLSLLEKITDYEQDV